MKILKPLLNKVKIDSPKQSEIDIKLNRHELRILETIFITKTMMLEQSVIPGYESRLKKSTEQKDKDQYIEYLSKAKNSLQESKILVKYIKENL